MNKFLKLTLKIILGLVIFVVVLLISAYFFIQTDTFNKIALNFGKDKLNESWAGKNSVLEVESLQGNILKGLVINKGTIITEKDTLLQFSYVTLKYDIWGLLNKEIRLDYLVLNSPRVNLTKVKDADSLVWNFTKLFSSSTEPNDTSTSAFDWGISVKKFKIENGTFKTSGDSVSTSHTPVKFMREFDFNNLLVGNLEMELTVDYFKNYKNLSMKSLSFNTNSDFKLKHFNFDAGINIKDTVTDVWNFNLATDISNIKIDKLKLNTFNPFDSNSFNDFYNKNIEADIKIDKFNFKDLKYFLPTVDMLDSVVNVSLNAKGKYGDMYVNDLTVKLPDSYINVKGRVQHLDVPDSMYLDVKAENLAINPSDVLAVYYDRSIKDYEQVGKVSGNLEYRGTFTNFYSKFNINTANAGGAYGNANLDLDRENYSGKIQTSNFNLGKILKDNSLNSRLNLTADFDGTGFALNHMRANVNYNITRSIFAGYDISSSIGKINTAGNNIKLNVRHISSFGNVSAVGRVNIANMKNPVYVMKGNVSRFNLAALTKKSDDKSNLNFSFDLNGRGASLENINGDFNFNIQPSYFAKYEIPQTPLNVSVKNGGGTASVNAKTDFIQFDANGTMNIGSITKVIMYNIAVVSDGIGKKLAMDSIGMNNSTTSSMTFTPKDNFELAYDLKILDSAKANKIFYPFGMKFDGTVNGKMSNTNNQFASITKLDVKNFVYQDTTILLKDFNSDIDFKNNYALNNSENSLSAVDLNLNATGDKTQFGNNIIDSLVMKFNLANSEGKINLFARQDTSRSIYMNGNINIANADIKTVIDSLKVDYGNYHATNFNNWIVNYTPNEKVNFEQFAIQSKGAVVHIKGDYALEGTSDLKIESQNLKLSDVFAIMEASDTTNIVRKSPNPIGGSIKELVINFKGDTKNPTVDGRIISDSLVYGDTLFGSLRGDFKYENQIADLNAALKNATDTKGTLMLKANMPYTNPLSGDTTASLGFAGSPIKVEFNSKDFQLQYFLKLIPGLTDARGILNGKINAEGTVSAPNLTGSIKITDGNMFVSTTGMPYNYTLAASTANSKLVIDNLSVSNIDEDTRHIDIHGNIDFTGMKINDIDLGMTGDMVILDKSVDRNDLGVYGYLLGGPGTPPITIKGNLDKLKIAGQFLIKDATISSVPMNGSGYDTESDEFTYVNGTIDTTQVKDTVIFVTQNDYKKINPFEKFKYALIDSTSKPSIIDFDLNVKTAKTIYVSIDFNNLTRDRLFGEVQADMTMKTEGKQIVANGRLDVVGNSYYKLYRNFKISNSSVTFDGPIDDPSINVQAVYTGSKPSSVQGLSATEVKVMATITGKVSKPTVELKLLEGDAEVSGSDAQGDAITYLLFGKFKSELTASERQSVASSVGTTVGSNYISSILSSSVRDVLPFLVDAEFNYTEGKVEDTDIQLTSEFGDATVKVGGKLLKEARNFDFVVDYPLNKMFNLNLPETLLMEFFRQEVSTLVIGSDATTTNTGIKIIYKIKF